MNRIHRTVWSEARQANIVAHEHAASAGRPASASKALVAALGLALGGLALPAAAADFYVGAPYDNGDGIDTSTCQTELNTECSLSSAIQAANSAGAGPHNIYLRGNIELLYRMRQPIEADVSIIGTGAQPANVVVSCGFGSGGQPFFVGTSNVAPTVTLQNFTVQGCTAQGGVTETGGAGAGLGGAVFVYDGAVTLSNMVFTSNVAQGGNVIADLYMAGGGGMFGNGQGGGGGLWGGAWGSDGGCGGVDNHANCLSGFGLGGSVSGASPGFGGGGAFSGQQTDQSAYGQAGAFGGGGGGASASNSNGNVVVSVLGGDGGFGGGGGYASGGANTSPMWGEGGFGGGAGQAGSSSPLYGGGGAGLGGAVFVRAGTLTLQNVAFNGNNATGGASPGNAGQGLGGAMFVCTNDLLTGTECSGNVAASSCGVSFNGNSASDAGNVAPDVFWSSGVPGNVVTQADVSFMSTACPTVWTVNGLSDPVVGGSLSCPSSVTDQGNVTCSANVSAGYVLTGATGGNACGPVTVSGYSIQAGPVTGDCDITAQFGQLFMVSAEASPPGAGNVVCTPTEVVSGGNVVCEATPTAGYEFLGWGGACAGQTGLSCVLDNVTASANVLAQFVIDDGDGVTPQTEGGVPSPGGGYGDGNGDSIPDSQQPNVVSLPAAQGGASPYGTVVSPAGTTLVNVQALPKPGDPALAGVSMPFGVFAFTVDGVDNGASTSIELFVPRDTSINAYLKRNRLTGQWDNIATTIDHLSVTGKTRIVFPLIDGGPYDNDALPNGSIQDPGGPAVVAAAPGPVAPVPLMGPFGLAGLAALVGMGGLLGRRRERGNGG